ncbi:MAG TPA: long-chain-acyl-CoA synthetase [Acetobacteraceae bacterium]|nr:long-chain-acyl-CoA synthetase [Acetobacteraceae bacterium]
MSELPAGNEPLRAWTRALARVAPLGRGEGVPLPALLPQLAERFGTRPALLSDGSMLSYEDLTGQANRYARWALQEGVAPGEVVCLLLANCPEYVAIWLGITSVGGVVALLNTNLAGDALVHAFTAVAPKHIIAGDTFRDSLAAVSGRLPTGVTCWTHGAAEGRCIDRLVADLPAEPPPDGGPRAPSLSDTALYIYTSGTTGLPKAARVSHRRVAEWSHWFAGMIDTQPDDRMYNCLPMYHSVGGIVAVGAMLVGGGSVLVRPRFSASRFWDDVADRDCTVFQYIGELCRYLLASPPHPRETAHRLRLCCGNGLRGDVWEAFRQRFRIPRILEFYAATEGNVSLYNCTGRPGAIGHIPAFLAHRFPVALVRCDAETGEPLRGPDGLCIACRPDEVGEALGKIGGEGDRNGRPFEGYTDGRASDAKVLRDVFARGDAWFRTGDLMRRDATGFYYFVDRLGDTFRWKGENVATEEVAQALRSFPGVADAVVYGVKIPGMEGRAGMAAITVSAGFEPAALYRHLAARLPEYARPLFLRIASGIDVTGTFKPVKAALTREGYDPRVVPDPLYCADRDAGAFVPLDPARYERIGGGQLRL